MQLHLLRFVDHLGCSRAWGVTAWCGPWNVMLRQSLSKPKPAQGCSLPLVAQTLEERAKHGRAFYIQCLLR